MPRSVKMEMVYWKKSVYNWHGPNLEESGGFVNGTLAVTFCRPVVVRDLTVTFNNVANEYPLRKCGLDTSVKRFSSSHWQTIVWNYENPPRPLQANSTLTGRGQQEEVSIPGNKDRPLVIKCSFVFLMNALLPETSSGYGQLLPPSQYFLKVRMDYERDCCCIPHIPKRLEIVCPVVVVNWCFLEKLIANNPNAVDLVTNHCAAEERVGIHPNQGQHVIAYSMTLPYAAIVHGEIVPVFVRIHNRSSLTIRSAELILLMELTNIETGDRYEKNLDRFKLERVPAQGRWERLVLGLMVPNSCCTDNSFLAFQHIQPLFFVRLKLTYGKEKVTQRHTEIRVGTFRGVNYPLPLVRNDDGLAFFPESLGAEAGMHTDPRMPFDLIPRRDGAPPRFVDIEDM